MDVKSTLVIPIKSLSDSKSRLKSVLSDEERISLMSRCISNVISAGFASKDIEDIFVVSNDLSNEKLASEYNINFFYSEYYLNKALSMFVDSVSTKNIVVCLGDLPLIENFDLITSSLDRHDVVISPDRHKTGTNILGFRKEKQIPFYFGENSFDKHIRAAINQNAVIETVIRGVYMLDIDTDTDLVYI